MPPRSGPDGATALNAGGAANWLTNGFWAILDQASFAATNFILSVLMARWLDASAYGGFSVAYSIYLLLATFHTAALTEPMLVYGPVTAPEHRGSYLRALLQAHTIIAAILTAILAAIAAILWGLQRVDLAKAFTGLAASGSFMILLWFARRIWYMRMEPRVAALSGVAYLSLCVVLAALLHAANRLDVLNAFLLLGAVAAVVDWMLLRGVVRRPPWAGISDFSRLFKPHAEYARWALPTSALTWVPANLPYVTMPMWSGLHGTAELRVVMTLAMPMIQTNYAIGQMLLPTFAQQRGGPHFARHVRRAFAVVVGLSVAFWVALAVIGRPILDWLYAGRYPEVAPYLLLVGAFPVLNGLVGVQQGILRAHDRPRLVFWAYAAASLAALVVGIPLTRGLGLEGAIGGIIISYMVLAIVLGWHLR